MTAKEKADELFNKFNETFYPYFGKHPKDHIINYCLICVDQIINSNPHSNPFNTNVVSTMGFWLEVKKELENK